MAKILVSSARKGRADDLETAATRIEIVSSVDGRSSIRISVPGSDAGGVGSLPGEED